VEKAISILEALSTKRGGISLSELSQHLSYPTSTTYRLLNTLSSKNYVRKNNGLYQISYGILRLQALSQQNLELEQLAQPLLTKLEEKTELTTSLAIRDGLKAVLIGIIKGSNNLVVNNNLGKSVPLHVTAVGKCLLAFLPQEKQETLVKQLELKAYTPKTITNSNKLLQELVMTRNRGYGIDNEEFVTGIRCIGAPVFNYEDEVFAAISVSGLASQIQGETLENCARNVIRIGKAISSMVYVSEPRSACETEKVRL